MKLGTKSYVLIGDNSFPTTWNGIAKEVALERALNLLGYALKEEQVAVSPGTIIKINNAGQGARGADGLHGMVLTDEFKSTNGLCVSDPGINILIRDSNKIWRISVNADVTVIE